MANLFWSLRIITMGLLQTKRLWCACLNLENGCVNVFKVTILAASMVWKMGDGTNKTCKIRFLYKQKMWIIKSDKGAMVGWLIRIIMFFF